MHAQASGLLEELWGVALGPDAAARLDLKSFLANPSVGGEAQMAAEMWWGARARVNSVQGILQLNQEL